MITPILILFITMFVALKITPTPPLKMHTDFYIRSRGSYFHRFVGINDEQMAQALVELGHTEEIPKDGKFARISGKYQNAPMSIVFVNKTNQGIFKPRDYTQLRNVPTIDIKIGKQIEREKAKELADSLRDYFEKQFSSKRWEVSPKMIDHQKAKKALPIQFLVVTLIYIVWILYMKNHFVNGMN